MEPPSVTRQHVRSHRHQQERLNPTQEHLQAKARLLQALSNRKPLTQKTNESYNQLNGNRRANIEIFTDEFVETLTNKPPRYEKDCQTEFVIEKPIVRLYMPVKTGVDT